MFIYNEKNIIDTISHFRSDRRVAFALASAMRLVQNLSKCSDISSSAKQTLTYALTVIRRDLDNKEKTSEDWKALLKDVMSLLPDEETGDTTEMLDDAVAATAYTIRTMLTGSSQEAAWSARRCYENADATARRHLWRDGIMDVSEQQLLGLHEVQGELRWQYEMIELLMQEKVPLQEALNKT